MKAEQAPAPSGQSDLTEQTQGWAQGHGSPDKYNILSVSQVKGESLWTKYKA